MSKLPTAKQFVSKGSAIQIPTLVVPNADLKLIRKESSTDKSDIDSKEDLIGIDKSTDLSAEIIRSNTYIGPTLDTVEVNGGLVKGNGHPVKALINTKDASSGSAGSSREKEAIIKANQSAPLVAIVPISVTVSGSQNVVLPISTIFGGFVAEIIDGTIDISNITTNGGSVIVDWGDGTLFSTLSSTNIQSTSNGNITTFIFMTDSLISHKYVLTGRYNINIAVTVAGFGSGINPPPTTMTIPCQAVIKGNGCFIPSSLSGLLIQAPTMTVKCHKRVHYSATFVDLNNLGLPSSNYIVTIDWGDQRPPISIIPSQCGSISQYVIRKKYRYKHPGVYNITILVNGIPAIGQVVVYNEN